MTLLLLPPRAVFGSSSNSSVLTQSRAEVSWFNTRLSRLTTDSSCPYLELFCSCLSNLGQNGSTVLRDSQDFSFCMYACIYMCVCVCFGDDFFPDLSAIDDLALKSD